MKHVGTSIPMRTRYSRGNSGIALVTTLIIAFALVGLGLLILFLTKMERLTSTQVMRQRQTYSFSDVEMAYMSIGRQAIATYDDWNKLLGDGVVGSCSRATPVTNTGCVDEIAKDVDSLKGPYCKGRILRISNDSSWTVNSATSNPFNIVCSHPTDTKALCDCRLLSNTGTFLPFVFSLYVRNDAHDTEITKDNNGEITLVAESRTAGMSIPARVMLAYSLSAWTQEGLTYNIWQTGSIERQTGTP